MANHTKDGLPVLQSVCDHIQQEIRILIEEKFHGV